MTTASGLAACAFDWSFDPPATSDDGGLAEGSVGDGPQPSETAPPGDSGMKDGGGTTVQACSKTADCTPGDGRKQYCHFADFRCGTNGANGLCTDIPTACPLDAPVCACNGKVYASACEPPSVGIDLARNGCPLGGNQFQCGPHICSSVEYCQVTAGATYACVAPKDPCSPLTCTCPEIVALMCLCSVGAPGQVTITCK